MAQQILLKIVVLGVLLLVAAACTNGFEGIFARTESGGVVTYALRTELVVLMIVVLGAMALVAYQWRRRQESSWVALAGLCAFFALVMAPIMTYSRVRIAEDYFEDQYFYWWYPAVDRYEFADLAGLRVASSTSSSKGMKVRSYRLVVTNKDGRVSEVTMGDSRSRATLEIATAARKAGVSVSGISNQLKRDAGQPPPERHAWGIEKDTGDMLADWNRRHATLQRVEALQEEFGFSDAEFEQLLQDEWTERNPGRQIGPWQFRLGDTGPTFWRTMQDWDYDAVRERAEEAAAATAGEGVEESSEDASTTATGGNSSQ